MSYIRNFNYAVCLATGRVWTLTDAADYLAAHQAGKESWSGREEAYQGFISSRNRLLAAMHKDVDTGALIVNELYPQPDKQAPGKGPDEIDLGRFTVHPFVLISWALDNGIEVPQEFLAYVQAKKKDKSAYYECLGLKKSTIHHERSRAVAELLWSQDPGITIADMARRSEIVKYGCQGHEYDMRTISRWLATLKADRRPGQPKKKDEAKLKNLTGDDQK